MKKSKFYIKLILYSLPIIFISNYTHNNYVFLLEHIQLEQFNPILYTKYLLNFLFGLGVIIFQFSIIKTDVKFLKEFDKLLKRVVKFN